MENLCSRCNQKPERNDCNLCDDCFKEIKRSLHADGFGEEGCSCDECVKLRKN